MISTLLGVWLGLSGLGAAWLGADALATPRLAVGIVRPLRPGAATLDEALVRLAGELASEGFRATWLDDDDKDASAPAPAHAPLAALGAANALDAVVAFPAGAVELWIVDRTTGRTLTRRLSPEGIPSANELAIRAMGLVRASLIELDLASSKLGPTATPTTATPTTPAAGGASPSPSLKTESSPITDATARAVPPNDANRSITRETEPAAGNNAFTARGAHGLGIAAGGVAFGSTGGVGLALAPLLRIAWSVRAPWLVSLTAAGGGTRARVDAPGADAMLAADSSAEVSQQYVLVSVERELGVAAARRWHPFVALAGGALRTAVEGRATTPRLARNDTQWSFLLDVGGGTRVALPSSLFLELGAHLQTAQPYPVVRFEGTEVASSAHPTLALALALGAWL